MKVENSNTNRISQKQAENAAAVERNQRTVENEKLESANGKDQASVSEKARLLAKIRSNIEEVPDIRTEKVNNLRDQISAGTYKIPVEQLANYFLKGLRSE